MRLASRFGYTNQIRRDRPLTHEELMHYVPSIFGEDRHTSRSKRYAYIPTITVLESLQREGFQPFFACQTRVRDPGRRGYTKHMLRLRRAGEINGEHVPEIILLNSHIRHILAVRKSALLQIDTLIRQLAEISVLTESIGGKTARDWAMKQDFRCGCWLMEKPETAMKAITRNLDREIWRGLMQRSGMLSLMDAQARDTWYRSLEYDNFPEISEANIWSTFEQLHQNKDDVFERGVINVFRVLSWNYKTNSPCKFGSKIIVNNLVRWDRWGFHLNSGQQAERLTDLERMLHLFSGKPIPDNRENITIHLDEHIQSVQGKEDYEDEMFSIRYFKKGSAYITFRKPELVDRLNDIIAEHYPDMLSV